MKGGDEYSVCLNGMGQKSGVLIKEKLIALDLDYVADEPSNLVVLQQHLTKE